MASVQPTPLQAPQYMQIDASADYIVRNLSPQLTLLTNAFNDAARRQEGIANSLTETNKKLDRMVTAHAETNRKIENISYDLRIVKNAYQRPSSRVRSPPRRKDESPHRSRNDSVRGEPKKDERPAASSSRDQK